MGQPLGEDDDWWLFPWSSSAGRSVAERISDIRLAPDAPVDETPPGELGGVERRVLEFERLSWRTQAAKEAEILARFRMPPIRYYQLLNRLVDEPAALAFDPVTVGRLRRMRGRRR